MPRNDPLRSIRFRVEIDGIEQTGCSDVIFPEASIDVIEYRDGSETTTVRKLAGLTRYSNLVLRWGLAGSTELYDWWQQTANGDIERKDVSIVLVNERGEDAGRWESVHTWPVRYTVSPLEAAPDTLHGQTVAVVATETIELAVEGFRRTA